MNPARMITVAIAAFVALIALSSMFFVVHEYDQALVLRLKKPVRMVSEPGLHFKIPLIEETLFFEKRILEWDGSPDQIPTSDNKYIYLDTMARWRIVDPLKFYQSVRNERGAQTRLDDIIDASARDAIASHKLLDSVRTSDRIYDVPMEEVRFELDPEQVGNVDIGREELTKLILKESIPLMADMGIELVDVRIKRVNYIESVRRKVYDRMISAQKRIAARYRSEGQGKHAEVIGQMERELKVIRSEAYRESQIIKGGADARATKIYADAYNRSPEFYSFMQTLESYRESVKGNHKLIITTNSDYYKYLKRASR